MEADHSQQPAWLQPVGGAKQQLVQHPQLIVYGNAQGLKGAGGWMDAAAARRRWVATRHQVGQLGGVARLFGIAPGTLLLDLAGNPPRQALLTVAINKICQLALAGTIKQLTSRLAALGVHAHIERPLEPEAEAPGRHIQLRTAHAQIGQHRYSRLSREVIGKVGGHNCDPIAKWGEALGGGGTGAWVLVQPHKSQAGIGLQQQRAVAAAAEGAVDQQACWQASKAGQHRLGQHGHMFKRAAASGISHGHSAAAVGRSPAGEPLAQAMAKATPPAGRRAKAAAEIGQLPRQLRVTKHLKQGLQQSEFRRFSLAIRRRKQAVAAGNRQPLAGV